MANYHYLHMKINQKDLPKNFGALFGKKYEIIGFSFERDGVVDVELCRLLTKRASDELESPVKNGLQYEKR